MEVNCEGCAGCCLDWRPLVDDPPAFERGGRYEPLDDAYNLAPLSGDEVRAFLAAGYGDAMTPRLFAAEAGVAVDGHTLAAVDDRPAFYVGLRKIPKPVAPFDADTGWLPTCVFLDPAALQCRIHGSDRYPETCSTYPGENLVLDRETECERVERRFGGDRLLDDDPPDDAVPDPYALGATVFTHPDPGRLHGRVARIADGEPTAADRAEFVAVAAASPPGTTAVDEDRYERALERVLEAESWVGTAAEEWADRAADGVEADPSAAERVEESRGAPGTPGWE
jgi:Fe-S-cluster containining protein